MKPYILLLAIQMNTLKQTQEVGRVLTALSCPIQLLRIATRDFVKQKDKPFKRAYNKFEEELKNG